MRAKNRRAMEPPINNELNFKWARIPSTERAVGRQRFISAGQMILKCLQAGTVCVCGVQSFKLASLLSNQLFWQPRIFRGQPDKGELLLAARPFSAAAKSDKKRRRRRRSQRTPYTFWPRCLRTLMHCFLLADALRRWPPPVFCQNLALIASNKANWYV